MRISGMIFALSLLCFTSNAHADSEFGLNGMFGFGGEEEGEIEVVGISGGGEGDLDPTLGFGVWSDTSMTRFLRIGGEARFLWLKAEPAAGTDTDRQLMMHFCPTFRVVFPLMSALDVFVRFAPGFSVAIPSDDAEDAGFDAAFGFNISGFGGLAYRLTEDVGLLLEAGFLYHKVYGEVSAPLVGDVDYNLAGTQFMLDFGLFF